MDMEYEIIKEIGVISVNTSSGWRKEVNLISWSKRVPKIDIRDWSSDRSKMSKGITFTDEEAKSLAGILGEYLK